VETARTKKEEVMSRVDVAGCLRDTYAVLSYIPPPKPEQPLDCRAVVITKFPKISFTEGWAQNAHPDIEPVGFLSDIEVKCAIPSSAGAGGVVLVLQVTCHLKWDMGFMNKQGKYVTETHRVKVSLPIIYKMPGERIALMQVLKGPAWIAANWSMIVRALVKIQQMEEIMSTVVGVKKNGMCPKDIKALNDHLQVLQKKFNEQIQKAAQHSFDDRAVAARMRHRVDHTGCFAGVA
jgi:hypothetical protein